MKDNFWSGFEKRAFEKGATPLLGIGKVLSTGLKGIGSSLKSRVGQWGSGAQTGMKTLGNIGRDVMGHARTMGAGLKPHLALAANQAKGWFRPSSPTTAVKPPFKPGTM